MIESQGKIIVLDGVLTEHECQNAIEYYNNNGPTHQWHTFYPRHLYPEEYSFLPFIEKIRSSVVQHLNVNLAIDWCELVHWPTNAQQGLHFDASSDQTVFTSITYLNADYMGGRTFIDDDIELIPKLGRTVCFDGNHYLHGVTEITQGVRFTLPIWYKKIGDGIESKIH